MTKSKKTRGEYPGYGGVKPRNLQPAKFDWRRPATKTSVNGPTGVLKQPTPPRQPEFLKRASSRNQAHRGPPKEIFGLPLQPIADIILVVDSPSKPGQTGRFGIKI
jgi:hypothetical protein